MSRKVFRSILMSLLSIFFCIPNVHGVETLRSVALLPNSETEVNGIVPSSGGIYFGLWVSTNDENIEDISSNLIWPKSIKVEIVDDKGRYIWKRVLTVDDGYEVLRGRNMCSWEILPSPDRRNIKDPLLRSLIQLDRGNQYSIHVTVGQIPVASLGIKYHLEILQATPEDLR